MGALTIAFDTTIAGALALPWVLLVIHLFFFEGENRLPDLLKWVQAQQQPAVAGVLLFAMTYTLGSAVSRIAQDFFNDDDLYFQVSCRMFRMGVTENRILTAAYCKRDENALLLPGTGNPALRDKILTFQCQKVNSCKKDDNALPHEQKKIRTCKEKEDASQWKSNDLCAQTLSWFVGQDVNWQDDELNDTAADIFGLQESALLLKGQDATQRLHQLHDQVMVLRGTAFNALVATAFCLYAWGVRVRREKTRSVLRWIFVLVPGVFLIVAVVAFTHHLNQRSASDPPYMEFSLLLIGLAGAGLLWLPHRQPAEAVREGSGPHWRWGAVFLLSVVLMVTAMLGWWATELAYAQEVIYHYDSLGTLAQK